MKDCIIVVLYSVVLAIAAGMWFAMAHIGYVWAVRLFLWIGAV